MPCAGGQTTDPPARPHEQAVDAGEDLPEVSAELARLHEEFGDYAAAEAVLRGGLHVATQVPPGPPLDRHRARLLGMLVRVHRSQGRYTDARSVADDALLVAQTGFSPGDPTGCEPLIEVGRLRQDLEDIDGAEQVFRRAEQIVEEAPEGPARSAAQAMTLGALGGLGTRTWTLRSRRAVAASGAPARRDGVRAPLLSSSPNMLNDLGIVFKFSGRFNDAKPLYLRALTIIRDAVGMDAPDLASIYHNLGGLEHARGDYLAAEPYARTAIQIRERALGADHVAVAADKAAYASIIDRLGRDARGRESTSARPWRCSRPPSVPSTIEIAVNLNNLAAVLQRRGDLAEAGSPLPAVASESRKTPLAPQHPALANTLNNLATTCQRQGKLAEAEVAVPARACRAAGWSRAPPPNASARHSGIMPD